MHTEMSAPVRPGVSALMTISLSLSWMSTCMHAAVSVHQIHEVPALAL